MKRISLSIALVCSALMGAGCMPDWAARPAVWVSIPASIDPTGATDVSAAFQSFVSSVPNDRVIALKPGARYRMEETIHIANRHDLTIDGQGATVFATTPGIRTRSNFRIANSQNIVITDLKVVGANPNAGLSDAAFVLAKEAQHGFDVRSVVGFSLLRVTVTDPYGDFVYLGKDEERTWTTNVVIQDSTFDRNGRMGISMTAARNVLIERNTFNHMRRSSFDMEAHHPGFGADNVTIRDNVIGGTRLMIVAAVGIGAVDNFTFEGNRVAGVLGIRLHSDDGGNRSNWKILNNRAATVAGSPNLTVMEFDNIDGLEIHGNYQPVQTWRAMVGARAVDSCNVNLEGNNYPGAVAQGAVTGQGC